MSINTKANRKNKITSVIRMFIAAAVFVWGVALRAVEVLGGNYLFGFDHGRDYLAAYNIAVNHKLTLIGAEVGAGSAGLSGLFHGPGYFYLIALMFRLFHGDPYGGLVLMFLFGVLTLIGVFISVRQMFGYTAAVTALFLTGISPLIAPQSRFIWNHHPSSFFIVIVFYLAYLIPRNPRIFAPLALFVAGLLYHFELAIAVPVVIALAVSLPLVFRIRDVRTYFFGFISVAAAFLPMVLFEARHGFMAVRGLVGYVFTAGGGPGKVPWIRVADHLNSYVNNAKDTFAIESGLLPQTYFVVLSAVLLIILIFLAWKASDRNLRLLSRYFLILLLVTYSMFFLLDNTVWDYYLIHIHFIFIYVFSVSSAILIHLGKPLIPKVMAMSFVGIYLLSMGVASYKRMDLNYRVDFADYGGIEKIRGKRAVIDYVYEKAGGKPFNVMVFVPAIYTYPYEYLFVTYGKGKYGYIPGKDKKGDVYLIIEKDNQNWYKGWLETVIAGGTVVSSEVINTGHLVEHRVFPADKK